MEQPDPDGVTRAPPGPPRNNTMAVLAIVFAFVVAPLGVVFGIIARRQIRRSSEEGRGLALAGIVVGALLSTVPVLAVAVLLGANPFGLSYADPLSRQAIEPQVATRVRSDTNLTPSDVRCPDDIPTAVDRNFTCTASVLGFTVTVYVTVKDAGQVSIVPDDYVSVPFVIGDLQRDYGKQWGVPVTVSCATSAPILVGRSGDTRIPCTISITAEPRRKVVVDVQPIIGGKYGAFTHE